MAQLSNKPYPMPDQSQYRGNWKQWFEDSEKALNDIPEDRLYHYPVADGQAYYFVESFSPLILQNIPYLDAWQLPYAHIRGLRLADIRQCTEGDKYLRKLFGKE